MRKIYEACVLIVVLVSGVLMISCSKTIAEPIVGSVVPSSLPYDRTQAVLHTPIASLPKQKSIGLIVGMSSTDPSKPSGYFRCKLSAKCEPLYWVDPQSTLFTDISPNKESFITTLYDPINLTYDLFLLGTSGGEWKRLTRTPETEYLQDWSITNSDILYIALKQTDPSQPPTGTLFIMDIDNNQQQSIDSSCDIQHARWVNSQGDIIFGGSCNNKLGIYQMSSIGTNLSLLVMTDRTDFDLSPTRNSIVFNSVGTDGTSEVLVLNLEDKTISAAPHEFGKKDMGGFWIAPDGEQLSFISTRDSSRGNEYIWDRKTGQVYPAPWGSEGIIAWSTDREYRLVNSGPLGNSPAYILKDRKSANVNDLKTPASMDIITAFFGLLPDENLSQPISVP